MKTYIALLKGINVSGQKTIKMADLKLLFEELNFKNVITYIQSGNVIFNSKINYAEKLQKLISNKIKEQYSFGVEVIIKTPSELEYVLNNNPFLKKKKEADKLYITFLQTQPTSENIEKLKIADFSPEEFVFENTYIFLFFPNGYGNAKMNNNFFEKKLKVPSTSRNWQTVNKLFELSNSK
jgi:uncharacterized protein (DUF1697 family)